MTGSERTLEERLRETQTFLAVSQAVGTTLDLTETLRRVARETVRALGADMGGAYVADPGGIALRPVAGYRVPKPLLEAIRQSPIPLRGHRFLEEAWEGRRPVWSSDAATDPRLDRETRQRFPYRSILFVPMEAKGEPIGGFFVVWWAEAHPVTPEELRLVEGISRQAARWTSPAWSRRPRSSPAPAGRTRPRPRGSPTRSGWRAAPCRPWPAIPTSSGRP